MSCLKTLVAVAAIGFLLVACVERDEENGISAGVFRHQIAASAKPWTDENFDSEQTRLMFAVFSDLTGGERENIFAVALEQLALLRPELIMSVGDLIEGGTTDREQIAREWQSFDARASQASAPLFRTGGNHDLSNLALREFWVDRFGVRYYHFVYKNVLFLILDTEDSTDERMQEINIAHAKALKKVEAEGWGIFGQTEYSLMPEQRRGTIREEQAAYFRQVIAENPDVRWTFLFLHKAPWLSGDEQNFASIEKALADRPYTVFHGHEHNYMHEKRLGRDYIQLGTTGGVQYVDKNMSIDHVTLVTVSESGVDIANLRMSGIFDKTGRIPLDGDSLCFNAAECL